ncbi:MULTISPECIES: flagellar hook-length control protein FliK [unclassified Pseudomonas]|uniref:flagellar hook-length control protein FliK n=1 Tax=unclassified Pseudomonas TaxID=196821 RepID=UPI0021C7BDE7|nr:MULTISPECIES: flagellar hook-length control protein FliK [unclassified Pseudomonas]MCU1735181.1 flagellar hook-length control protein FliK [Pseudomonas sp. 20P_3.2_Bac4]MCU1744495.1 flagellar hook-length control protein FliK [Pseudomonas sp. 20P_3.2_Bac5]
MPVASNPLLQTGVAAKTARAQASNLDKASQALNDKGPDFSKVYAQHSRDKVDVKADAPVRDRDGVDKPAVNTGKADDKDNGKVADSGNDLPDDKDAQAQSADKVDDAADTASADGQSLDANLVAGQLTDAPQGAQLLQAQAQTMAPVIQAAAQQPAAALPATPAEDAFDPDSDPLADLPVLRLALEQNAQAQGTTSTHAAKPNAQPETASGQPAVNTLAQMLDPSEAEGGKSEGGEKAFAGLIDDGLKDLKGASSDTRVDDFANRLASLTQAATPKTANAVAPAPLHQPLAMNQGGWTEGLVNRVMYLSSQSLKSADIQLEPAELGRLDIRVNLASDQAAQITFTSGHAGVRDALEGQVHRLRELFNQQGLAQPDVNVADQSREQQNGRQDDTPKMSGVAARRNADGADTDVAAATAAVESQVVVGSSTVDYFA